MAEPLPPEQLATLCHDLRSRLTTVSGALCLMEDACGPELPDYARRALDAGLRAIDHITEMLAGLEAGEPDGSLPGHR